MRRLLLFTLLSLFLLRPSISQDHHPRFEAIDVLHYRFEIDLNDSTNIIRGIADLDILFKKELDQFHLDLASFQNDGTGMKVEGITVDGKALSFFTRRIRLLFTFPTPGRDLNIASGSFTAGFPGMD